MSATKTIREFYRHSRPPVVLSCAQHMNLLSVLEESFTFINLDEDQSVSTMKAEKGR